MVKNTESPLTARLFSIEMVVAGAVFLIGGAGIWFGMAGKVEASQAAIKKIQSTQTEQGRDIQSIKIDIAVVRANQSAQKQRDERQEKTTQRILDILQTQVNNRN